MQLLQAVAELKSFTASGERVEQPFGFAHKVAFHQKTFNSGCRGQGATQEMVDFFEGRPVVPLRRKLLDTPKAWASRRGSWLPG
jgi:hypothetical protein